MALLLWAYHLSRAGVLSLVRLRGRRLVVSVPGFHQAQAQVTPGHDLRRSNQVLTDGPFQNGTIPMA